MKDRRSILVVDRIEGTKAVLLNPAGESQDVPVDALPENCRKEGRVLRVKKSPSHGYEWHSAEWDAEEEKQRKDEVAARLQNLKDKDKGGDIAL